MIDNDMSEIEFAAEVGCRVIRHAGGYQYQTIDPKGSTISVRPTQEHAYDLWMRLWRTSQQLAAVVEGGEAGGAYQPKSRSSQLA